MLFSVVIPTYNRAVLISRTLDSLWRQSLTDFEVIVVDDGSNDGTSDYLRSLQGRIQCMQQENRGPGAARNLGAASARGDYVAFLDSDDVWFPWTLATVAEQIQKCRSPAMISASVLEFGDESELANVVHESPQVQLFDDYLSASATGYYVGSGMAILRRDDFLNSGGFSTLQMNCEDHDLALRLGTAPGFLQIIKPVTLGWRRHACGASVNVRRTFEGVRHLVTQEQLGKYPAGNARSRERREIICRHLRPVVLECLRQGMRREAWELYRTTFGWHVKLGRWKFLAGVLVSSAWGVR